MDVNVKAVSGSRRHGIDVGSVARQYLRSVGEDWDTTVVAETFNEQISTRLSSLQRKLGLARVPKLTLMLTNLEERDSLQMTLHKVNVINWKKSHADSELDPKEAKKDDDDGEEEDDDGEEEDGDGEEEDDDWEADNDAWLTDKYDDDSNFLPEYLLTGYLKCTLENPDNRPLDLVWIDEEKIDRLICSLPNFCSVVGDGVIINSADSRWSFGPDTNNRIGCILSSEGSLPYPHIPFGLGVGEGEVAILVGELACIFALLAPVFLPGSRAGPDKRTVFVVTNDSASDPVDRHRRHKYLRLVEATATRTCSWQSRRSDSGGDLGDPVVDVGGDFVVDVKLHHPILVSTIGDLKRYGPPLVDWLLKHIRETQQQDMTQSPKRSIAPNTAIHTGGIILPGPL